MKRICLVSSSFSPAHIYGGPIFATCDLSKQLSNNGFHVYVSTTNANGANRLNVDTNVFIENSKNVFVKYYNEQLINKFSYRFIFGISSDIKKSDFVYIQYLFHYTVLFSLLFAIIHDKKIIICPRGSFSLFTLNNSLVFLKSIWLKLFVKPFLNKIQWHASSYIEREDILTYFSDANVIVIHDGIDCKLFKNEEKINVKILLENLTNNSFDHVSHLFFSMGRLHKIKRFDVLIDAFHLFVKKYQRAKLVIAGADDGVERDLIKQINYLNLSDSVFLLGPIDFKKKKQLYHHCDVFCLASEFESFGIVVAESFSCGTPVVVSNKTPWKEIEKNNCGIFTNNDKYSFYEAFIKIIRNQYNKDAIYDYVESRYSIEKSCKDFVELILK